MCGIFCEILNEENSTNTKDKPYPDQDIQVFHKCRSNLERRGPNSICEKIIDGIRFFGTVLHHQGLKLTIQPVIKDGYIFLFNGDLFMNLDLDDQSDTDYLASLLDNIQHESDLKAVIKTLRGPYSLIYYNRTWKKLYFLRDSIGRNSLLVGSVNGKIFITSVCSYEIADYVVEVPPIGIYCLNLRDNELSVSPWYDVKSHTFYQEQISLLNSRLKKNLIITNDQIITLPWLTILEIDTFTLNDFIEGQWNLQSSDLNKACTRFIELLSKSVAERALLTTNYCKTCPYGIELCDHCRVGILFSGGLDCSILAILADKVIPKDQPIDLFNVAFEKVKRIDSGHKHHKNISNSEKTVNWDVPDRITAKSTLEELRELCPNRRWNLIEVNVTRDELEQELTNRLRDLISPSKNILDESLGAALWFSARGKGTINDKLYESTCRVLLLGSGADELFGGYSRHRNAYKRASPRDNERILTEELDLDWIRLPNRNLARDDRVISDHSMTPRTPYLQEDVIQFVRSLKANQRCNLNLEPGFGDKLFLRLCAYKLGLKRCCMFKKRALQFGSRIADSRQKADNVSTFFQE